MENYLFNKNINGWSSWENIFQSINEFKKIIEKIFSIENLPITKIENQTPGTCAVFKIGVYIIKIFPPLESSIDFKMDFKNELFGLKLANKYNINSPNLISYGELQDKYIFRYIITEYIDGIELKYLWDKLSNEEKYNIGKELKKYTDSLNQKTINFTEKTPFRYSSSAQSFNDFQNFFKKERDLYINSNIYDNFLYVHGDLTKDNILFSNNEIYIIDFADSLLAPKFYEDSLIISELFSFDKSAILGYFDSYDIDKITDICIDGLLIHNFGGEIIKNFFYNIEKIKNINDLKNIIKNKLIEKI